MGGIAPFAFAVMMGGRADMDTLARGLFGIGRGNWWPYDRTKFSELFSLGNFS
jgi:hypothetical protein